MILRDPTLLRLGLGLTALILVGLWGHLSRRRRLAEYLGGQKAVDRLSRSNLYRVRLERALLLGLSGLALSLAAAEPRWSEAPEPGPPVNQVIIAIDVSASMQASDVSPTRLARAVGVANELLNGLEEHRVGLLLFAGTGYPLAPPTFDHEVLRFLLQGVTPTIASALDPGTLISAGIEESIALLGREARVTAEVEGGSADAVERALLPGERHVVLIGDGETGENDEGVVDVVGLALEVGVGIHTVGVGTSVGGGMIMPAGTYQLGGPVRDAAGVRGVSRLQEPLLREVAVTGGGEYASADSESQVRGLGARLAEPGAASETNLDEGVPPWARYDAAFVLGLTALIFVLMESLLDMPVPGCLRPGTRKLA